MSVWQDSPEGLVYRVTQNERLLTQLSDWRREVDKERSSDQEKFETMTKKMDTMSDNMEALRRVLIGFALTLAGTGLTFALTVIFAVTR